MQNLMITQNDKLILQTVKIHLKLIALDTS